MCRSMWHLLVHGTPEENEYSRFAKISQHYSGLKIEDRTVSWHDKQFICNGPSVTAFAVTRDYPFVYHTNPLQPVAEEVSEERGL